MWNSWREQEGKFQTNIRTCGTSGAPKHFHVLDGQKSTDTDMMWRDCFPPHVALGYFSKTSEDTCSCTRSNYLHYDKAGKFNQTKLNKLKKKKDFAFSLFICLRPDKSLQTAPRSAPNPITMSMHRPEKKYIVFKWSTSEFLYTFLKKKNKSRCKINYLLPFEYN